MKFHFAEVSRNRKLGPMPVVTSAKNTCPPSCPLIGKGGCYAEGGPLRIHWDAVSSGKVGVDFDTLCSRIARLPRRQLWRYGQAGDLPGEGDHIDEKALMKLARVNRGRPVIAFTHKPPTPDNLRALEEAREIGFHVNLSADDLDEADELASTGFNTVVVLKSDYARRSKGGTWSETITAYRERIAKLPRRTAAGRKIAVCPATYTDTRCIDCGACATKRHRHAIIGFPAHGSRRYMIDGGSKQEQATR